MKTIIGALFLSLFFFNEGAPSTLEMILLWAGLEDADPCWGRADTGQGLVFIWSLYPRKSCVRVNHVYLGPFHPCDNFTFSTPLTVPIGSLYPCDPCILMTIVSSKTIQTAWPCSCDTFHVTLVSLWPLWSLVFVWPFWPLIFLVHFYPCDSLNVKGFERIWPTSSSHLYHKYLEGAQALPYAEKLMGEYSSNCLKLN